MGGKIDQYAHVAFGDTNRADGVPDFFGLDCDEGPVYLEGRLVLSLSFQADASQARLVEEDDEPLERYRLWDDLEDAWHDDDLTLLRYEQIDAIVRSGPNSAVLWKGAIDTRARVIPEPDLDLAGLIANSKCDLRWKRA